MSHRADRRPVIGYFVSCASALCLLVSSQSPVNAQRGHSSAGSGAGHSGGHVGGSGHSGSFNHSGGLGSGHSGGFNHSGGFGSGNFDHFGGFGSSQFGSRFRGSRSSSFVSFGLGYSYPYYSYYPYYAYDRYYDPYYDPYVYEPIYREPRVYEPIYREPRVHYEAVDRGGASDDDYYLYRGASSLPKDPALTEAVSDIEKSFRTGDIHFLERHVADNDTLAVIAAGHTRSTLTGAEYLSRTREAFKSMKTERFELGQARASGRGESRVSGMHVFRDDNDREKRFHVTFTLTRNGEKWMIRDVSADPE